MARDRTIIDLLDDFFGSTWTPDSIHRLSDLEVLALAGDVEEFYANFELSPVLVPKSRSYSGGSVWSSPGGTPRVVNMRNVLPFAHPAILYSEQVVFDCPLDSFMCSYRDYPQPGKFSANNGMVITPLHGSDTYGASFDASKLTEARDRIWTALDRLDAIAPAIRDGWLVPVPHLRFWKRRKQNILAQVRHDVVDPDLIEVLQRDYPGGPAAVADNVRGLSVFPDGGIVPRDANRALVEGPAIYFNSVLAVADITDSRYLPTGEADFALLLQKIARAVDQLKSTRDGLAVRSIRPELMPTFDDETFETVCQIRRDSAAFNSWRQEVEALASGEALGQVDIDRAQEVVDDKLREHCARVREEISRSTTLSERLDAARASGRELGVDVGLAATTWAVGAGVSAVTGAALSIPGLIAGVSGPLLKRALKAAMPSYEGSASVIYRLDKRRGAVQGAG